MKKLLFVVLITIAAFFLRVHDFTKVPPSLDWDEAAVGYNAYSILKTSKDEFGVPHPLAFRSFDDWKSPLYIYLAVPLVAVFGLTETAVRMPAAFFGSLTVFGTYFLTRKLIKKDDVALLSTALLAVSPWHLQFSRVGFEPILVPFFVVWGTFLFMKSLEKGRWIVLSSLFFALTFYSYVGARFFVPLLILLMMFSFRKRISFHSKSFILSAIVFVITLVPLFPVIISSSGRVAGTSIFAAEEPTRLIDEWRHQDFLKNFTLSPLFHNKPLVWAEFFVYGYLKHFSPAYLFGSFGQLNWRLGSSLGLFYLFEFPLILVAVYKIISGRDRVGFFLIGWLLLAPVPAAFTTETPHALRSIGAIPAATILSAWGFSSILSVFKRKQVLGAIFLLFAISNIVNYFHFYYNHYPFYSSFDWQYGHEEAFDYIQRNWNKFDHIVFVPKYGRPYIFALFYLKYDPQKYQSEISSKGSKAQDGFDKFQFRNVDWKTDQNLPNTLFVAELGQIDLGDPHVKKTINFKMPGEVAFVVAETGRK